MLFTNYSTLLVFLPLINGKSLSHLFQTIIRKSLPNYFHNHLAIITLSNISNPVNHLSESHQCSPSHTIGQQRQDNNHVSHGSKGMSLSIISKGFWSPDVYLSLSYWIFSACRLRNHADAELPPSVIQSCLCDNQSLLRRMNVTLE